MVDYSTLLPEAMPFGTAVTPDGSPTALSGMLAGIMGIPKHLIDAAKESAAHDFGPPPTEMKDSDPVWKDPLPKEAFNAALMTAGMGAPAAEAGAAGIFGGKLAKTADIEKLIEANKMATKNEGPARIWDETGWAKSPVDHKWKFEIPDNASHMNPLGLDYTKDGSFYTAPAGTMFEHPSLYKAYPQLTDYKMYNTVLPNPPNGIGRGSFNANAKMMEIEAPNLLNAKSVALHELQHGVQHLENFAPGGTPSYIARMQEQTPEKLPIHEFKSDPFDIYHRLGGEVESRNVQDRMNFTPNERAVAPPWYTHDTAYADQLVYDPRYNFIKALRGSQ